MPATPDWLERLTQQVLQHLYPADLLAPVGCHVYHDAAEDRWEVTLFASRTEVVGGQLDGKQTCSWFAVDVLGLSRLFADLSCVEWQTHRYGAEDDLGAHLSLEGYFEGTHVWLRVLAESPPQFDTGRYILPEERRIENVWES